LSGFQRHDVLQGCDGFRPKDDTPAANPTSSPENLAGPARVELSRLLGVRRTITSMAMREIKGDISFANAVGHTQQNR
jgi:Lrp/AsnC family leucine-responsive transcriptional regulator